jgi:hypothetical protein
MKTSNKRIPGSGNSKFSGSEAGEGMASSTIGSSLVELRQQSSPHGACFLVGEGEFIGNRILF